MSNQRKIKSAIDVLIRMDENPSSDEILGAFNFYGIKDELGKELYVFLPIAFCRLMLPEVKFPKHYIEKDIDGNETRKKFKDNLLYNEIIHATKEYFSNSPKSDQIIKIAGLSAEFSAINQLLKDSINMENIKLTEMIIVK